MDFIKNFKELSKNDVAIAGGKGASLGEMTQAGIPVPEGFVILSNAFEYFLEETDLNVEIDAALDEVNINEIHTVENASEKIKALIKKAKIPENIKKEIDSSFKKLNFKYIAVRSSATSEDSATAAWAGQLESFLNTTKKNLLENVRNCWASLFTPRAIVYRFEKNLRKSNISVAVVIQKMVESEESGIAFSVHPVTQDENQLIIEAGFGLGEAIVSGQITPDSYVVDKQDFHIIDKNINEQNRGLYRYKEKNEWKELGKKGKEQVLKDKNIIELSRLIIKIENHYNFPVDVEFARQKGKFYIVQSRPITTLTQKQEIQEKSTDYIRMFESTGIPFLINTIALEHYKPLKAIAIFRDNLWTTYLPKKMQEQTLKEGVELFRNKNNFNKYAQEFNEYKKHSIKLFEEVVSKKNISKEELNKFFDLISELWFYYRKTEFFYVDDAYRKSQKDKLTAENLKHLEEIKNSGREHMNKMIFGSSSYLAKALNIISKQFNIDIDTLFWSSKTEILSLYDKVSIDISKIKKRKNAYVFLIRNGDLITFDGIEAKDFISSFLIKESKDVIRGVTANPGKVKARAKVMKYGADTFDKVSQLVKEMKAGDILVAETTSPEIMAACKKASAILTNQGGLLSHAAIVSRELGIPCIVGLENITQLVKDGDILEVDADNGIVKILPKNIPPEELYDNLSFFCTRPMTVQRDELGCKLFWASNKSKYISVPDKGTNRSLYTESKNMDEFYKDLLKNIGTFVKWKEHLQSYKKDHINFIKASILLKKVDIKNKKDSLKKYYSWINAFNKIVVYILLPYAIEKFLDKECRELLKKEKINLEKAISTISSPETLNEYQEMRLNILNHVINKKKSVKELVKKYYWYGEYSYIEPLLDESYFKEEIKKLNISTAKKERQQIKESIKKAKKDYAKLKHQIKQKRLNLIVDIIHTYTHLRTDRIDYLKKGQAHVRGFFDNISKEFNKITKILWNIKDIAFLSQKEIEVYLIKGKIPDYNEIRKRVNNQYIYYFDGNSHIITDKTKIKYILNNIHKFQVKDIKGLIVYKGKVRGIVKLIFDKKDLNKIKKGDILVAKTTMPDYTQTMRLAAAVVTDEGGIVSHAAIVSRELKKPCIVGTKVATEVLKDGDYIEVDANKGIVRILKK